MKNFFKRFLVLLVVFILGVAGTAFLMNNETTDDRSDMNDAVPATPRINTTRRTKNLLKKFFMVLVLLSPVQIPVDKAASPVSDLHVVLLSSWKVHLLTSSFRF